MKEFQGYNQELSFDNTDKIDIRQEIDKYRIYWMWFVVGLCVALFAAYFYIKYTPAQYSASAFIMIKDNLKSGISEELKVVADLGIVGTGSTNNPENEIFIIKSRKIVGTMVDSLELNISYFVEEGVNFLETYNNSSIELKFINKGELYHSLDTAFVVSFLDNDKLQLKNTEEEVLKDIHFNEIVESKELGDFKIIKNTLNRNNTNDLRDVLVVIKPRIEVISEYAFRIEISSINEDSSILHLNVIDHNKTKAESILDELIRQYNLDAVIDKNIVSNKTKDFIEDRLKSVGYELGLIQDSLKEYKNEFGISGHSKEAELAITSISERDAIIIQLETKLNLINWAEKLVAKQSAGDDIFPSNLGFSDEINSQSINVINQLILEKHKLQQTVGDKNPNLLALEDRIKVLKQNLKQNFNNLKVSTEIQLKRAKEEAKTGQDKVSQIPSIERGIVDIQRQKIIYSELYSYLLKKKEEIAISLAVTVPNAKIIDVAFSSDNPVSPNKKIIYLIAAAAGLLIPFILIYIRLLLDTKFHNRKDIEDNLNVPYLGDIPHSENVDKVIVTKDTRTSTAEAFRILRTNLNFMLPKNSEDTGGKIIFLTSTMPGEGKSFVSINLAATLALTNKKVLLLGLDLRAPKITEYLGIADCKGITNYILDDTLKVDDIKFTTPEVENVDFISSGLIPPNPSELLSSYRVKELFETVKKDYDFVIADTAPISLVTDTLLIANFADIFLYVARANFLDKKMLVVPRKLYEEKKLPNMAIVLNDTDSERGYGYGYGYIQSKKKPFYKRLFGLI
jgi:tyrosine-protein kinase Etk/Wzc